MEIRIKIDGELRDAIKECILKLSLHGIEVSERVARERANNIATAICAFDLNPTEQAA